MAERRPLIAGLKTADPELERQFVHAGKIETPPPAKPSAPPPPAPAESREGKGQKPTGKQPLTTRIRADFAAALKRASLERQLAGEEPNTLQDILEEALDPWLRTRGYIK